VSVPCVNCITVSVPSDVVEEVKPLPIVGLPTAVGNLNITIPEAPEVAPEPPLSPPPPPEPVFTVGVTPDLPPPPEPAFPFELA
jgi:hypothetical protein